jgi:mono/diheme cytochrome c family protein
MGHLGIRVGLAALATGLLLGQGTALAASAEKGKVAYMRNGCFQCHGTVGQGSVQTSGGRVITDTALPYEAFAAFVRTAKRQMPPYSEKILSNDDLADIYAYLKSLPKTADYKTVPLLKQ